MSKIQEPFFNTQLECPICKSINEHENIKVGSYSESGRDTDFCPTGRAWQNPAYQKYDPLLFFMATCKKCHYTHEFNGEYKNWQKDSAFKTYRQKNLQEKHLAEFINENGVIRLLGNHIDVTRFPFESSVIKFLLGVYDEKLLDRPSKLDLGRYFLRIGWLFRGNGERLNGGDNGASGFFFKLKGVAQSANQMPSECEKRLNSLKDLLDHDFGLIFNGNAKADEFKGQLLNLIDQTEVALKPVYINSSKLVSLFDNIEKILVSSATKTEGYFEFANFSEFLLKAKQLWNEVPLSEIEALTKARDYYQEAYETGDKISAGAGQIQAAYLIAELSRRTGNFENAGSFFNQVIRSGREIVQGRKGDASTINFTKKVLEMAMDQARLSRKEGEGLAQ
jgi:hypothetical protein